MAKELLETQMMRLRRPISLLTAFVLVTMMVCPLIAAAAQASRSKTSHQHCSSEEPQDPEQSMRCCYDQNAVSVQEVRATFETQDLHLSLPETTANSQTAFLFDRDYLPYLRTGDHLAKLSTLRL